MIDTVGSAPSRTPDLMTLPAHPGTHLVERLSLSEDRRHLEYEFTLHIPEYLKSPRLSGRPGTTARTSSRPAWRAILRSRGDLCRRNSARAIAAPDNA